MKRKNKEEAFLNQLEKVPNISLACEKLGISRNTVYRWRNDDPEFNQKVNSALESGILGISDLAESKLIGLINQGSLRAIMYWLENNSSRYSRPNLKEFREKSKVPQPVDSIQLFEYDTGKIFSNVILPKPPEPPPPNYP
ncbi:MAG: hypothetical protein KBB54_02595 [Candidatus Pacebacteria bacterium]|nr:hypothetical protein [Candidatus Paceibacterota bacterium]MBP9818848.1 hypothetical protein [Candidatus Paceibacterota bacterium]